ncbi:MAG TPA: hypothetical protein VGH54_11955 [Mycobacterium sp.]|uniref:hypothetical protein n=1 Tax=Mycobacterium sp. TaxID=1785 RepID=UPI002F41EAA0
MSNTHDARDETTIRYQLTWPAWMSEQVTEAASARSMSVATWLREAALEKLERTEERRNQP